MTDEKTASFVDMLAEIGHESPIEHASFTFGIEGCPVRCWRRLPGTVWRPSVYRANDMWRRIISNSCCLRRSEAVPEAKAEYLRAMEEDQRHYERLTSILKEKHLHTLMQSGMNEKAALRAAEKKAIEDARFVLPNACTTKMLVTMNARSLRNFFRLRCCNRAQWEIRELAEKMLYLCREVAPHLFRTAGPACVAGPCPEGKMSCGRAAEMRNRYTVRD